MTTQKNNHQTLEKLEDLNDISDSDKLEVCSFRLNNVPPKMKACEIYNLLTQRDNLRIIDIKIETRNTGQKDETNVAVTTPENTLALLANQGVGILNIDKNMNKHAEIQKHLDIMEKRNSCVQLRFDANSKDNEPFKLNEITKKSLAEAGRNLNPGLEHKDCDDFLQNIWKLYEGQEIKEEKQKEEEETESFSASLFGLRKFKSNDGEKRTAFLTVIGKPRDFKREYNNEIFEYDGSHKVYLHFQGLRKGISPSQSLKHINLFKVKKSLKCHDVDLGIFNPQNPQEFWSYFKFSKTRQNSKKSLLSPDVSGGMYFTFNMLQGKKTSKRVQIILEVPALNKFVKVEFTFKLCEKIFYEKHPDGKVVLSFELTYSPRYALMGMNDNYYQHHSFSDNWERLPNFGIKESEDELFKAYLNQSTVIRITFAKKDDVLAAFLGILKSVGLGLEKYKNPHFILEDMRKPFFNSRKLANMKLSFNAKYALLACLSHKEINLYDIDNDFIRKLEEKDDRVVEKTFQEIASKNRKADFEEKAHQREAFQDFFWEKYEENRKSKPQWEKSSEMEHMAKTKRVTITPTQTLYHVEEAELSNSVLRRYKDNVNQFLRVTLSDEVGEAVKNMRYISEKRFKKFLKGLSILTREYHTLAFSSSQLKNNSLWMFAPSADSLLTIERIHEDIGDLSGIKNPAKRAARLGQLFSASFKALTLDKSIAIYKIDDIKDVNQKYTFSDGVGRISTNLIEQIKLNQKIKGIISAIQVRCGGVKGILVSDPTLPPNSIYFRKSMIKFESSSFDQNLELLDYSKYRPGYLNRQIILLLLSNGLNPNIFLDLQKDNVLDLEKTDNNDGNILSYVNNEHHLSPTKDLLKDCIDAEVDITREPFVKAVVETIKIRSFINLKEKTNILVKQSVRLTGVIDESGILEYGQIYLCISPTNGEENDFCVIKADKVVITKNPCLHPGDIRVLQAVDNEEVRTKFKHLINVVVFPSKGPRPHTDEISGSDLDGDMYFVSWDERLIPPQVTEPMSYEGKKPEDCNVSMDDIIDFFIEFTNNDVLGKIDNSHLALADCSGRLAQDPKCKVLAELHAVAVDYAKTRVIPSTKGIEFPKLYPDYMEKEADVSYESSTILGELYRLISSRIETSGIKQKAKDGKGKIQSDVMIDLQMVKEGYENYLEEAYTTLKEYYKETDRLLKLYGIQTEYEIFSGNFLKFMSKGKNKKYNLEKLQEKMINHIELMKDNFNEKLLKDFETESDFKNADGSYTDKLCQKASAIYILSYYNSPENCKSQHINKIMQEKGYIEKLEKLHSTYQTQMIGLPWYVFKEVILDIKKRSSQNKQSSS